MPILLAHLPTPSAQAALAAAIEQARFRDDDLHILSVSTDDALAESHHASDEALTRLVDDAAGSGVRAHVERVLDRDTAQAVLDFARLIDARLLVIGIRERSSVGKLLMGSTAQRIILAASCPVLAVKP